MFGEILILFYIIYLALALHGMRRFRAYRAYRWCETILVYRGGNCGECNSAGCVILQLVIISFAKWELPAHFHFLITTVCNFAMIALFILVRGTAGRRLTDHMNIPISSWIVLVGKSVSSINYMARSRWVAHRPER